MRPQSFDAEVGALANRLAALPSTQSRIHAKKEERDRVDLAPYREAELVRMHRIFADPHHPYHGLRRAFVRKERPASATAVPQPPFSRG